MGIRLQVEEALPTFGRLAHHLADKQTAIAFDTLYSLLAYLQDVSLRVDARLAAYHSTPDKVINISVVTMELWSVLDTVHRIYLLFPLLHIESNPLAAARHKAVKDLRDSFQHFDERITKHYQNEAVGDSVLGDFRWQYREVPKGPESFSTCYSGINIGPLTNGPNDMLTTEDDRFIDSTGVYNLELWAVKRVLGSSKGDYKHEHVSVVLDEVISGLEKTMKHMALRYEQNWVVSSEAPAESRGFPGRVLTMTIERLGA